MEEHMERAALVAEYMFVSRDDNREVFAFVEVKPDASLHDIMLACSRDAEKGNGFIKHNASLGWAGLMAAIKVGAVPAAR
jgi:hypothetical protein